MKSIDRWGGLLDARRDGQAVSQCCWLEQENKSWQKHRTATAALQHVTISLCRTSAVKLNAWQTSRRKQEFKSDNFWGGPLGYSYNYFWSPMLLLFLTSPHCYSQLNYMEQFKCSTAFLYKFKGILTHTSKLIIFCFSDYCQCHDLLALITVPYAKYIQNRIKAQHL